jgi:hypothetical protein
MQLLSQTHGTPRKMRSGGAVHGPGTGTSDSIPALLSNGEYVLPADTVAHVGRPALDALRSLTHTPVQKFADGGLVDDPQGAGAVTRVGNSYSGMDVRGNISVNGQAPAGTYNENPGGGAAAILSTMPRPASPVAAAPIQATAGAPAATATAPVGAPPVASPGSTPVAGGWADRNAQRNLEVTASSIVPSQARTDAQAQLGAAGRPAAGIQPAGAATAAQPQSAASRLSTITNPEPPPRRQPVRNVMDSLNPAVPRFADGGLVDEEALRRAAIAQIPTGGQMQAPAPDGSQANPLNTELGRNALNTLSALPGAAGLTARAGGAAARGAANAGGALSADRVIPAAWEVVQDGGAVARAAQEGGTLSRAASTAMQQPALSGNAAQLLSAPPSRALAERATTAVGEAAPQFARGGRGPVPWADVVEPAALTAQQASPAASALSSFGGSNLGRALGTGAALGSAAIAGSTLDPNGGGDASPLGAAQAAQPPGAAAATASPAAQALAAPPAAARNNITRDGNSYSGPANISGDITINGVPTGSSAASLLSSMPARSGGISAQNMAAADALAQRQESESLARLGLAQPGGAQPGFTGQIGQASGYGNMWSRTPEQQRRDAEVSASSIHRPTAARGAAALQALDVQDLQQLRNQGDVGVEQVRERGANARALFSDAGATRRQLLENQGAMDRQALQSAGTVQAAQLRAAAAGGKAPDGYRWSATGGLEAIPGGPADIKNSKEGQQQIKDSSDVISIATQADQLLNNATGSVLGAGFDALLGAGGKSTPGGDAAAQLKVLQGMLVSKMPKMSGPQSDKDVLLYREMAGQIGDAKLPASTRRAALDQIYALNAKYASPEVLAGAQDSPLALRYQAAQAARQGAQAPSGAASATEQSPAAPAPARSALQSGQTYQTARGPARWDGQQFELIE